MEKTDSSNYLKNKIFENSNKLLTQNIITNNNNTKKRIHSEMININYKLSNEKNKMDLTDEASSHSITKNFENLAIKKQFKVNKIKSISKYYAEKPNNKIENNSEGIYFT